MSKHIPKEDLPLILELSKTLSRKEIADKWEVVPETISRFLKRHGYAWMSYKANERMEHYKKRKKEGALHKEIAAELDMSCSQLFRMLGTS